IEIDGISQVLYQNLSDVDDRGDITLRSNEGVATVTAWTTANTNDTHTKSLSMDGVVNNKVYHKTDFTHYRNVSFLKALGGMIIVTDKVVPGDSQSHTYTQNWHSEPYSNATITKDSYYTGKTAFASGPNLTIAQTDGTGMTATVQKGYDSTAASTTTTYFEYKQTASGTVTYQTVLYPTSQGQSVSLNPTKLSIPNTADATARAMKVEITDSSHGELKTLYYYNSFEAVPTKHSFDIYTTDGQTVAISMNTKGERLFVSLTNGTMIRITGSSLPVLETSRTVTDLSAYMDGTTLCIETSDPSPLTAGIRITPGASVEAVCLNGKTVAFSTDSNGTVTLTGDALILHFNESSPLNDEGLWFLTRCTAEIDPDAGILYGNINSYDPYIRADKLPIAYTPEEGDVIELRLKVTSTNTADKGTQVFFLTSEDSTWNSSKSKFFSNAPVNQGYQTLSAPFPASGIGKVLTALRIDPVNTDKTSTSTGTYEIDYLYIGPEEYAPSQQPDHLYFDFDGGEDAFHRYQSPIYGGRDYDRGSWSVNEGRNSLPAYDPSREAVRLWITSGGATPYLQTSNASLSKSALVLNYVPHKEDIMEIRFRFTDCTVVEGTSATIRMYYVKNGGTMGNSDYVPVAIPDTAFTSGDYVTVRVPMSDAFTSASVINTVRPTFNNIRSLDGAVGSVTIDYLYIGPLKELPNLTYNVTFLDWEGQQLESCTVAPGGTAVYTGAVPEKPY
ncbi:MAG: hypothetical protein IKM59_04625, partial [Oscillospiraceae bacterium]|nr:hypothetical protein [Oscillospiraceae bacterium]